MRLRRSERMLRWIGRSGVAAAVLLLGGGVRAGEPATQAPQLPTVSLDIVIEGPLGPYPYGHAEFRVTVYEGALADAPADQTEIGVASEMTAAVSFPHAVKIDVPGQRLAASIRPQVGVVVSVGRRPAYWSDTATVLNRVGPTQVRVRSMQP